MVFSVISVSLWLSHLTRLHVLDALSRNRLRIGSVVEDLDRNPAGVMALFQRREDRAEIDGAEAGAAAVGVVGVEVPRPASVAENQVRHRERLRRHRLHVLVQRETGMVDALEHLAGLGAGVEGLGL